MHSRLVFSYSVSGVILGGIRGLIVFNLLFILIVESFCNTFLNLYYDVFWLNFKIPDHAILFLDEL